MGLPPTSSKISSDANEVTTFKFDFPNFTGTHTGTDLSLGVNSVAGGGTGLATLTANNVLLGNGTSAPTFVAPGTSGNVLTSDGTTWYSALPAGTSPTAYNYNGYYPGSSVNYWSTTSTSFTTFTVTGTIPTITQITNNSFGTVSNATSSDAGVNFVAPRTGILRVTFNVVLTGADNGQSMNLRLQETIGSTTFGYLSNYAGFSGFNFGFCVSIIGYLNVTVGTTYNVVVQGYTDESTIYIYSGPNSQMSLGCIMEYVN